MTTEQWLEQAEKNKGVLSELLAAYHPVNRQVQTRPTDRITAFNAEQACETVRASVRKNFEGDPVAQFAEALAAKDVGTINKLLNQAWFGVPESRDCWGITGFNEAVDLLEDPPSDGPGEDYDE